MFLEIFEVLSRTLSQLCRFVPLHPPQHHLMIAFDHQKSFVLVIINFWGHVLSLGRGGLIRCIFLSGSVRNVSNGLRGLLYGIVHRDLYLLQNFEGHSYVNCSIMVELSYGSLNFLSVPRSYSVRVLLLHVWVVLRYSVIVVVDAFLQLRLLVMCWLVVSKIPDSCIGQFEVDRRVFFLFFGLILFCS